MKSDDVVGRVKTYQHYQGENIPEPSIPESFKVLLKERSLLRWMLRFCVRTIRKWKSWKRWTTVILDYRYEIEGDSKG